MENYQNPAQGAYTVTVVPDKEEKKLIRRKYTKAGAVIILNAVLYNFVLVWAVYLIGGALGEGETIKLRAQNWLRNSETAGTIVSYLVPIMSETISIVTGMLLLKINFKQLFKFEGFTGKEVTRSLIVCLGLQTLAALIAAVIEALLKFIGLESSTAEIDALTSAGGTIFIYFYACLLGPVLEELLYRGVILQGLRKYNERFALIISALIFGLMHQNYQQFILAVMVGTVFAAADLKAGSLVPSVIMHIVVNTSAVLMQLIMENADYGAFRQIVDDKSAAVDFLSMSKGFIAAVFANAAFRYGMLAAGIVFLVLGIARGGNVRLPTPAGKKRGFPVLFQTPVWYIIFIGYFYLCFIRPMHFIK